MRYLFSLFIQAGVLYLWSQLFPDVCATILSVLFQTLTFMAPLFVGVIAWSLANYLAARRYQQRSLAEASGHWANSAMGLSIVITAWGMLDYFMALGASLEPDASKLAPVVASTVVGFGYPWLHEHFLQPRMLKAKAR